MISHSLNKELLTEEIMKTLEDVSKALAASISRATHVGKDLTAAQAAFSLQEKISKPAEIKLKEDKAECQLLQVNIQALENDVLTLEKQLHTKKDLLKNNRLALKKNNASRCTQEAILEKLNELRSKMDFLQKQSQEQLAEVELLRNRKHQLILSQKKVRDNHRPIIFSTYLFVYFRLHNTQLFH